MEYVLTRLKVSLEQHNKAVAKYKEVAEQRAKEHIAALDALGTWTSERDQLVSAIDTLTAKAARDDE